MCHKKRKRRIVEDLKLLSRGPEGCHNCSGLQALQKKLGDREREFECSMKW